MLNVVGMLVFPIPYFGLHFNINFVLFITVSNINEMFSNYYKVSV